MKKFYGKILAAFVFTILLASCGTTSNVTNGNGIQKRKYNKGFYYSKSTRKGGKTADKVVEETPQNNEDEETTAYNDTTAVSDPISTSYTVNETETANSAVETEIDANTLPNYAENTEGAANEEVETDKINKRATIPFYNKVNRNSIKKTIKEIKSEQRASEAGFLVTLLLIILALFLPWLSVLIYEGASTRFWLTLIFWLIGLGVGIYIFGTGVAYLLSIVAVIYAILIVIGALG